MDALSVAARIGGLTSLSLTIVKELNHLSTDHQAAPPVVNSLCSEMRLTSRVLSQLQIIVLDEWTGKSVEDFTDPQFLSFADTVFTGCSTVLYCLEDEVWSLVNSCRLARDELSGLSGKEAVLWKTDELEELIQGLWDQRQAVSVLVESFEVKSIPDLRRFMVNNRATVQQSRDRTKSLKERYSNLVLADSFLHIPGDVDISSHESTTKEEAYEFTELVNNTQVYRRARQVKAQSIDKEHVQEEITEGDLIDFGPGPEESGESQAPDWLTEGRNHDLDLLDSEDTTTAMKWSELHSHDSASSMSSVSSVTEDAIPATRSVFERAPGSQTRTPSRSVHFHDAGSDSVEDKLIPTASRPGSANSEVLNQASAPLDADFPSGDTVASRSSNHAPPPPPPLPSQHSRPSFTDEQDDEENEPKTQAFERWETLSAHWEGLTSFWLRRLEENTVQVNSEPLTQQLSRQVTDLSAAGANLFHAVVELQRLRASSERKFQRWFYETRIEQEKAQEIQAMIQASLEAERAEKRGATQELLDAKAKILEAQTEQERIQHIQSMTQVNLETERTEKRDVIKELLETKVLLQYSKREAQRAWTELGRREGEEKARSAKLQKGEGAVIGGDSLVPVARGTELDLSHESRLFFELVTSRDPSAEQWSQRPRDLWDDKA
ncbi:uncharacterized protein LY89DRAFT_785210 [Mollisia scopiformis]|uniref:Fungal N-terminal domain-containing protein n=1 Tax=Mollisia scopiformis TaxID=149040 RepID=A0A194X0Q4_MOLSC|nr:uncharacterized protein LY89DRAFT_785210 [Mollisia scopiformis]KUJ13539.1 hypothetical protein LY89DRAFT_785210 [Mollisia scopiformis]